MFKDRKKFAQMADPKLKGLYPVRGMYQALAVAAMCLQEDAATRPLIGDVVTALGYLASQMFDPAVNLVQTNQSAPSTPAHEKRNKERKYPDGSKRGTDKVSRHGSNQHELRLAETSPERHTTRVRVSNTLNESRGSQEGSGRDSVDSDKSDGMRHSPRKIGRPSRDGKRVLAVSRDREHAIAEAKSWGENLRERKRSNALGGSGTYDFH